MNKFHKVLLQLNQSNYEETKQILMTDISQGNEDTFEQIISQFISGINFRPSNLQLYGKLCCDICNSNETFHNYFNKSALSTLNESRHQFLYFIHYLMDSSIISDEAIVRSIVSFYKQPTTFNCSMFAFFYQECLDLIEENFFQEIEISIIHSANKQGQSRQHPLTPLSSRLYMAFDEQLQNIHEEDPRSIYQILENPLIDIFINDNVNKLQEQNINPSDILEPSILLPHNSLLYKPSLIQVAAFFGSIKCFKYLLERNPNLDYVDTRKKTILDFAIMSGNIDIIKICEEKGMIINELSLNQATIYSQFDLFDYFLTKIKEINWEKIFITSCKSEALIIMQKALEHNIPIDIINENLIDAAKNGKIETVKLLSSLSYIDINCTLKDGDSPLTIAVQNDKMKVVKYLLSLNNIDVNHHGIDGNTALHLAVQNENLELVKILIENKNVDINCVNIEKATPLIVSVVTNSKEICDFLLHLDGIDVNKPNWNGYTPLFFAAFYGFNDIVKILCENKNINISFKNSIGENAIQKAIEGGHREIASFLFNKMKELENIQKEQQ